MAAMETLADIPRLFLGTLLLRPYVFTFLAVYLLAAAAHIGVRRSLIYIPLGYAIAWVSEYSSIHWGFPYGDYYYIPETIHQELWVWGVPFMDSLSYVFLSYCSYSTALFLLSPVKFGPGSVFVLETLKIRRSWQTLFLGAFLFVLLDIVIDPVALQGYRWFLGQIYGYRQVGVYFGIPMSNFGGWLLVGLAMVRALQWLDRRGEALEFRDVGEERPLGGLPGIDLALGRLPGGRMLGPILYVSVMVFNLTVTFRIGEDLMGVVGCLILFFSSLMAFFFTLYKQAHITRELIEEHLEDFPNSQARRLLEPDRVVPRRA